MKLSSKIYAGFKLAVVTALVGLSACTSDDAKLKEAIDASKTTQVSNPGSSAHEYIVYFEFDDSAIKAEGESNLGKLADYLKANKQAQIQIEGHCDERGTTQYNLALGDRRAQSVKTYLSNLGVETARLSTISYGEERPAVQGHDESAYSKNRRAEFVITAK